MRIVMALSMTVLALAASAAPAADHAKKGYVTKQGVYVPPARQTNPNNTKLDNYGTKGNVNPYTGKKGTKDPYKTKK